MDPGLTCFEGAMLSVIAPIRLRISCGIRRFDMFGKHPELMRRLKKHGAKATAEVLTARETRMSVTAGNPQLVASTQIEWKLSIRVQPHEGPTFDVDVDGLFPQMGGPMVGSRVPVLYDPDDHSKVVIDSSTDGLMDAQADRIAGAMAKAGRVVDPDQISAALKESATTHDPSALRAALGVPADGGPVVVGGWTRGAATPEDPIELLSKLEQLHEKGALNDAQYEAQKQRLLGRV
jgi:hypothetical protein